jgi:hypothetical protein
MMLTISYRHPETYYNTRTYPSRTLYHSGNLETSIHGSWEDLPPSVMGYCSDDAYMEAVGGKVSKESL